MGREDFEVIISVCDNYIMTRGQDGDAAVFDRWNLKHKIMYWVLLSMVIAWGGGKKKRLDSSISIKENCGGRDPAEK